MGLRTLATSDSLPAREKVVAQTTARFPMGLIVCPDCQSPVSESAKTCPGCGYPITQLRESEFMCSFCGYPVQDLEARCARCNKRNLGAKCQGCGDYLDDEEWRGQCPSCGTRNTPTP